MKRTINIFIITFFCLALTACIENEDPTWKGSLVEFDAAIYHAPALGKTYPIITRVPVYGRAVITSCPAPPNGCLADPAITRTTGTVTLFVNLVGKHRPVSEVVNVSIVPGETTATEGVHFTVPTSITIPENSSVAEIPVTILDPGATTGSVVVVLQLDGNSALAPNENYKSVGLSIAQN
jgi:hypothetical protein